MTCRRCYPVLFAAVLGCVVAAPLRAQDADMQLYGNARGAWLIRPAEDGKSFAVARKTVSGKWKHLTGRGNTITGRIAAAAAVGDQLNALFHEGGYFLFRGSIAGGYTFGLTGDDPRWPDDAVPLAACEGMGLAGTSQASFIAIIPRPDPTARATAPAPIPATAPATLPAIAPATMPATQPATQPATLATQPTEQTVSSAPAEPMLLGVFLETGGKWMYLGDITSSALPADTQAYATATRSTLYLCLSSPGQPDRLWAFQPGQEEGPPAKTERLSLPETERLLALGVLSGRPVVVDAIPDTTAGLARIRLRLLNADGQWVPQPVTFEGSPRTWPADDLPLVARLGDQLGLVWTEGGELRSGTVDPGGALVVDAKSIDIFQPSPLGEDGEQIRNIFMWVLVGCVFLILIAFRRQTPVKPFELPANLKPAALYKRLAAAIIDYLPFLAITGTALLVISPIHDPQKLLAEVQRLMREPAAGVPDAFGYAWIIGTGLYGLYHGLMEYRFGATLGKMIFRLRVVGDGGARVNVRGAALRNIVRMIEVHYYPLLPLLLLFCLLNPHRQRLGDMMARTTVIDTAQSLPPEMVQTSEPNEPDSQPTHNWDDDQEV